GRDTGRGRDHGVRTAPQVSPPRCPRRSRPPFVEQVLALTQDISKGVVLPLVPGEPGRGAGDGVAVSRTGRDIDPESLRVAALGPGHPPWEREGGGEGGRIAAIPSGRGCGGHPHLSGGGTGAGRFG